MIKVALPDPPFDFSKDQIFAKKLAEELKLNEQCFKSRKKKKYSFTVYKDARIKATLVSAFKGKCAFCDSSLRHISYGDIEHFRPKSVYWWLAADWKNFLLACPRCNSFKRDKFPLASNSLKINYKIHSTFDEVETAEEPYRQLLNPYLDEPELIISYEENAEPVIKLSASEKLNNSITVYDLNRIDLVQERFKVLKIVLDQINRTRSALNQYNMIANAPSPLLQKVSEQFFSELDLLLSFLSPKQQYLGLCRQLIIPFFNQYGLKINSA